MRVIGGGVKMSKNFIFFILFIFSSSVFSQSGYFPGSTKDKLDDIEQQRMLDKLERGLDEIRRQNEELKRQRPPINPPIYSNPQISSDFHYVVRTKSNESDGDVLIIKSSVKRQSNSIVNYKTVSLFDKPLTLEGKTSFKTDYIIETKSINCRNNTSISFFGEFYLRDCSTCSNKKLQHSSKSGMKEYVSIKNNEQEFYEFNYLCR